MTTDELVADSAAPAKVAVTKPVTLDKSLIDLSPKNRGREKTRQRIRFWSGWTLRIGVPILLVVFWQLVSNWGEVSEDVLPSPKTIVEAYSYLWDNGSLQAAIPISLRRAGEGLLIGGTVGLILGIFAGLWKIGEETFDATLQMLRTVPFIAPVPLFVTWFGIDEPAAQPFPAATLARSLIEAITPPSFRMSVPVR